MGKSEDAHQRMGWHPPWRFSHRERALLCSWPSFTPACPQRSVTSRHLGGANPPTVSLPPTASRCQSRGRGGASRLACHLPVAVCPSEAGILTCRLYARQPRTDPRRPKALWCCGVAAPGCPAGTGVTRLPATHSPPPAWLKTTVGLPSVTQPQHWPGRADGTRSASRYRERRVPPREAPVTSFRACLNQDQKSQRPLDRKCRTHGRRLFCSQRHSGTHPIAAPSACRSYTWAA